jgi:large subunit ribosomal protein L15
LAQFADNGKLTIESLKQRGYLGAGERFKILGKGELTGVFTVEANAISASAKAKIEAAGGKVIII